jgi:hypothetical protein
MNKIINNKKSLFFALIALLLFSSSTSSFQAEDKNQTENQPESDTSLVQVIRELIGLPKRVAAGGSRSNMNKSVCLITPVITEMGDHPTAIALVPEPTIVTSKKLNEIVIRRAEGNQEILYRKRASSTKAVNNILEWPIKPIQAKEKFIIELRPLQASASEKAKIILIGADKKTLYKNKKLTREITLTQLQKSQQNKHDLLIQILFDDHETQREQINRARLHILNNSCESETLSPD